MKTFYLSTSCVHMIALATAMGMTEQVATGAAPTPNAAPPAPASPPAPPAPAAAPPAPATAPVASAPPAPAAPSPPAPATVPAPPPSPASAPAAANVTEAQMQEAMNNYARTYGVAQLKAKFLELNITKVGDIPAVHYDSYLPHFAVAA